MTFYSNTKFIQYTHMNLKLYICDSWNQSINQIYLIFILMSTKIVGSIGISKINYKIIKISIQYL